MWKLVIGVATCSVVFTVCNNSDLQKGFLRELSELYCFSTLLRLNRTAPFEQSCTSLIDIGDGECVIPPDLFLLVCLDI